MNCKFPRRARIRRKEEFTEVYRRGSRVNVFPLRVCYLQRPGAAGSRLGLAIGKKTGNAVLRNRWKRAVREAFRKHRRRLPAPCDMIISISWKAGKEDITRVETAFLEAMGIR